MVEYDFGGRGAVVTGGAKGIGLAIAQRLAGAGAAVAIWDMKPDPLRGSEAGEAFDAVFSVDVTEPASVEQAVQDTMAQLGAIDVLVNNAGVSGPTLPTWEYPLEEWDRVISADLTSVFLCSRAVIPFMLEQGGGADRERGFGCGQGGQCERVRVFGGQGGGDRAHEVAGQGAGSERHYRQLRGAGDGADRSAWGDDARVHQDGDGQDPDGTFWDS